MKKRTSLDIQLTDANGAPLSIANVVLDATLYTQGRKRYQFYAGKTDALGHLHLTVDSLEKERRRNQVFSMMDYNTVLDECDPRIDLAVPSAEELRQQQIAIRKWFPENAGDLKRTEASNNGVVCCSPAQVSLIDDGEELSPIRLVCSVLSQ